MEPIWNVHRHILHGEQQAPEASGVLSTLLYQIALAGKVVGHAVNKAGLLEVLGATGSQNVQGEMVQKLDVYANEVFKDVLTKSGSVCAVASEEEEGVIVVPKDQPKGPYIVHFDPLDGSSNIDANVSIGSIFAIHRKQSTSEDVQEEDILQPGTALVAAGYVLYGSATLLVYTAGQGVHGFTYDPAYGEFLLSHPDIKTPDLCKIYSVNESNMPGWPKGTQRFLENIKARWEPRYEKTTARYVGSLVADFHRNLLYGGIFLYPESKSAPAGKLRLLYEAAPLALLAEQAGGAASTGSERILDVVPSSLHQRVPLAIGNADDVRRYEAFRAQEL
jgi:fructose-1,6-bisphosphatase I